ncbi:MAG TPA: hypothetical protein VKN18_10960 [Blastocatellia bacterium]|nr:hypothetical protein [Blastocatellia bacterium]
MSKNRANKKTDETITVQDTGIDRLEALFALCKGLPADVLEYEHAQMMWERVSKSTQNFITNGGRLGIDIESDEDRCRLLLDLRLCGAWLSQGYLLTSPPLSIRLHVNHDGRIVATMPFLLHLLDGIRVDRIRLCLHCNSVFYARRGNKRMCSSSCGNVRRVQKSRQKAAQESTEYAARPGKVATKGAKYKRDYRNSHGVKVKARKRGTSK